MKPSVRPNAPGTGVGRMGALDEAEEREATHWGLYAMTLHAGPNRERVRSRCTARRLRVIHAWDR